MSTVLLLLHKLIMYFTQTPSICCLLDYSKPLSLKGNATYSITFHVYYSTFFSAPMYSKPTFLILAIAIVLSFFQCDPREILFVKCKLIFYRLSHNFLNNAAYSWQERASPFTKCQQITWRLVRHKSFFLYFFVLFDLPTLVL